MRFYPAPAPSIPIPFNPQTQVLRQDFVSRMLRRRIDRSLFGSGAVRRRYVDSEPKAKAPSAGVRTPGLSDREPVGAHVGQSRWVRKDRA